MKIDPKYFNLFLLIVAVAAAILIALFTLKNRSNEKTAFKERMFSNDSLQTVSWKVVNRDDSLRISDFKGSYLVLSFWANGSKASLESQRELARLKAEYGDSLNVIAAGVGLQKQEAVNYIEDHDFPFHFVAGSRQFSAFGVPGLPAQLIYNQKGELHRVYLGYRDNSRYDSLRTFITDEKNR